VLEFSGAADSSAGDWPRSRDGWEMTHRSPAAEDDDAFVRRLIRSVTEELGLADGRSLFADCWTCNTRRA